MTEATLLDAEIQSLRIHFELFSESLPSCLAKTGQRICDRIQFRANAAEPDWVGQFSTLTLLYPRLQAEPLSDIRQEALKRAGLAHLLLLIHSIIEDRQLDGQIELSKDEILFSKTIYQRALEMLSMVAPARDLTYLGHRDRLIGDYCASQVAKYTDTRGNWSGIRGRDDFSALAAGRASLGALASLALVRAAGADATWGVEATGAFDALTIGLQWLDDTGDLELDFLNGDENLILHLMSDGTNDVRPMDRTGYGVNMLRKRVIENEFLFDALDKAIEELRSAAASFLRLGCTRLGRLANELADKTAQSKSVALASIPLLTPR